MKPFWKTLQKTKQREWRQKRMQMMVTRTGLKPGATVLDLGGTPELWQTIDLDLDITLVNLPGAMELNRYDLSGIKTVFADAARALPFATRSFDLVFSNSVIEHTGGPDRQIAFADNIRQLGHGFWVQTPAIWFPIEPHCRLPGWWYYPDNIKQKLIRHWNARGQYFLAQQMKTTTVLKLGKLRSLFPDSCLYRERVAGCVKSYSLYCPVSPLKK